MEIATSSRLHRDEPRRKGAARNDPPALWFDRLTTSGFDRLTTNTSVGRQVASNSPMSRLRRASKEVISYKLLVFSHGEGMWYFTLTLPSPIKGEGF
jgi:hypothetical protein